MPSQKRLVEVVEDDLGHLATPKLSRIRNMWQFANLCQWIYIFGKVAKIDESIDIEEIEAECLKPNSTILSDIALALLKLVSSHRGLTHDTFDDQARKQYLAKSPDCNPFGDEDGAQRFVDFDIFTKIKVLQQLTQWTMIHPERIRDRMEEQRDVEQTSWRIEPYGWDSQDRTYYVLDDNRVYRLSAPPPSLPSRPMPKKKKPFRAGHRSSKRRRVSVAVDIETDNQVASLSDNEGGNGSDNEGLGGMIWECIAVTLEEVRRLLERFTKTRDENEKILRKQLEVHLVPILEKQEEARKRRELQRERELLNLEKMANAKRSSRIASKIEQQRQEEKERAEKQQREEAEAVKRREERMQVKMEKERGMRIASREKRLGEREARRLRHEEQLIQLSSDGPNTHSRKGRLSERHLQAEIERNKQALKDLEQEEEAWVFDCLCGMFGQVDDGTHSVACERCNVWQHSKCLGISEAVADRPDFQFICASCRRQQEDASAAPNTPIKLKLNHAGSSSVYPQSCQKTSGAEGASPRKVISLPSPIDVQASHISAQFSPKQETGVHFVQDPAQTPTTTDSSKTRDGDWSIRLESPTVEDPQTRHANVAGNSYREPKDEAASKKVPEVHASLAYHPTRIEAPPQEQEQTAVDIQVIESP